MSRRDELLALLLGHTAADERERASLEEMIQLASSTEDVFSREAQKHFTASAIVVDSTGERTCLVHHRKSGNWIQPGGHIEGDESPVDAALREVREETGLVARLHPSAPRPVQVDAHWIHDHYHLDLRFLAVADGVVVHDPEEVLAAGWVSWDEALAKTAREDALRNGFAQARRALRP